MPACVGETNVKTHSGNCSFAEGSYDYLNCGCTSIRGVGKERRGIYVAL